MRSEGPLATTRMTEALAGGLAPVCKPVGLLSTHGTLNSRAARLSGHSFSWAAESRCLRSENEAILPISKSAWGEGGEVHGLEPFDSSFQYCIWHFNDLWFWRWEWARPLTSLDFGVLKGRGDRTSPQACHWDSASLCVVSVIELAHAYFSLPLPPPTSSLLLAGSCLGPGYNSPPHPQRHTPATFLYVTCLSCLFLVHLWRWEQCFHLAQSIHICFVPLQTHISSYF